MARTGERSGSMKKGSGKKVVRKEGKELKDHMSLLFKKRRGTGQERMEQVKKKKIGRMENMLKEREMGVERT